LSASARRSFTIEILERADREVRAATLWWDAHRPAAQGALASEFLRACRLLSRRPALVPRIGDVADGSIRRLYLRRVRYYLYFRVVDEARRVEILALWHASRGSGPPI
jgi:plasmid stabilization system protein ParE